MSDLYGYEYFHRSDGIISWKSRSLKFGDALAGLCYAYGIPWHAMPKRWPKVFEVDANGRGESVNQRMVDDQMAFLLQNKTRVPKSVLEIGGGRGEVATVLKALGTDIVSVELGDSAARLYKETAYHFFGAGFEEVRPVVAAIQDAMSDLDLASFDTILMVESLEHIPAPAFDPVWEQIRTGFHGRFIAVNWPDYHPIWIGRDASPEEHCRLVDDDLYDLWCSQARRVLVRWGSHLVLEF